MVQMQPNYNLGGYITDLIIPVRMLGTLGNYMEIWKV